MHGCVRRTVDIQRQHRWKSGIEKLSIILNIVHCHVIECLLCAIHLTAGYPFFFFFLFAAYLWLILTLENSFSSTLMDKINVL